MSRVQFLSHPPSLTALELAPVAGVLAEILGCAVAVSDSVQTPWNAKIAGLILTLPKAEVEKHLQNPRLIESLNSTGPIVVRFSDHHLSFGLMAPQDSCVPT